jgi:hypothetical protein
VLIALTREQASEVDAARTSGCMEIGPDDDGAAALREIMIRTGGRAAVERMIAERVERADRALARAPVTEDTRLVLGRLVEARRPGRRDGRANRAAHVATRSNIVRTCSAACSPVLRLPIVVE